MLTRALPLAAVGVLALTVTACNPFDDDSTTRNESGEIEEGGQLGAFALQPGDCFNDPALAGSEEGESTEVAEVAGVPCEEPHDYQVYATFDVADAEEYPGEVAVSFDADEGCLERFEPFVGRDFETSVYNFSVLYPTPESWDVGDREIVCLLNSLDGEKLTGDAEGSGL